VSRLLIRGGTLVDPAAGTAAPGDLLIEDDRIAATGAPGTLARPTRRVRRARAPRPPGLVDMHVHLREPGYEYKETIATACRPRSPAASPRSRAWRTPSP
jgi:dihydroorotase